MGMAGSPEVLPEVVLGVGRIGYEQRKDARPADRDRGNDDQDDASHQAGLWTHAAPFFFTTCATRGSDSALFNVHEGCADAPWLEGALARRPAPGCAAYPPLAPLC